MCFVFCPLFFYFHFHILIQFPNSRDCLLMRDLFSHSHEFEDSRRPLVVGSLAIGCAAFRLVTPSRAPLVRDTVAT